ncbi:UDP-3-O-(3-hydroxymyristoyl)glucosamine N-acyltransferase [bacterium]
MFKITAKQAADKVNGKIAGNSDAYATHFCSFADAGELSITFVSKKEFFRHIKDSKASIVIMPHLDPVPLSNAALVMVENPVLAFSKILKLWEQQISNKIKGIHAAALIHSKAQIGKNTAVGANTIIEDGAKIGDNSIIMAGCYIGKNSVIANDCIIYPNVTILDNINVGERVIIHSGAVIGADGFGFVFEDKKHSKIPQIGGVIIGDDVEIGANTAIDRATVGNTKIGKGTKIDNFVQIAHNVEIGEHCIICGKVGIAGSAKIGNYVTLAGQAGVTGHITIGNKVTVAAQAGVTKNIPDNTIVSGYPAAPHKETLIQSALIKKLPKMYDKIKELEKKINKTE